MAPVLLTVLLRARVLAVVSLLKRALIAQDECRVTVIKQDLIESMLAQVLVRLRSASQSMRMIIKHHNVADSNSDSGSKSFRASAKVLALFLNCNGSGILGLLTHRFLVRTIKATLLWVINTICLNPLRRYTSRHSIDRRTIEWTFSDVLQAYRTFVVTYYLSRGVEA